jgi:hypothetical protein
MLAQGEAERRQPRNGTLGIQRNDSSPGGAAENRAGSGNPTEIPPPFQGGFRVLLVNPGFRYAARWATIHRPLRG